MLIQSMQPKSLYERMQNEPVTIIDVREPQEYMAGAIAGSTLIPLGELARRWLEIPLNSPVVMVCRSGNRSRVGAEMLQRMGKHEIYNLEGGVMLWQQSGLPLRKGRLQ